MTEFVVSPRFRDVVENHLVGNMLVDDTESPLMLGIFGPPGEGKTYQTERICHDLGISISVVSPGELESDSAGYPGELLRMQYLKASTASREGKPTILLVNDVDTVIGDWGPMVQYTVNRQVVIGQLMAFCDFPREVSGTPCDRVPILFTGNNPASLHGPLMRPGRMRVFEWDPSPEDRQPIIESLFPDLDGGTVRDLASTYPTMPIAFWADVKAAIWEHRISTWMSTQERGSIRGLFVDRKVLKPESFPFTGDLVLAWAAELVSSAVRTSSYLTERSG